MLAIAEGGPEIFLLLFFSIEVGMLLDPVLLVTYLPLEMKVWIKSDIFSRIIGVMKSDSVFPFLR